MALIMDALVLQRHSFLKKRSVAPTFGFAAVADFSSYIGQEYLSGIMQATADYGIHCITMADAVRHAFLAEPSFLPQFKEKTQFMRAPLLDGLITWASSLSEYMDEKAITSLFSSLSPLPMVDIGYLDIPHVPSIRIDNRQSMHLILSHLVNVHGFSCIAFIGTKYSLPHAQRLAYFKEELAECGLPCDEDLIFLADSLEATDVAAQVERLLQKGIAHVQAIVTSSDIIAAHILETLEKRNISVPDDIAVTGFNNQLVGITAATPITTIDLAYFERGYKAVELLIDQLMHKDNAVQHHLVQTSLVVRQSCGCFEPVIAHSLTSAPSVRSAVPQKDASRKEKCAYVRRHIARIFPQETEDTHRALTDAIVQYIYDTNVPPPFPKTWFVHSGRCLKNGTLRHTALLRGKKQFLPCARHCFRSCTATKKRTNG